MSRQSVTSAIGAALLALLAAGAADAAQLISRSSSGVQGNNQSRFPAISANGRYISFQSDASNLVANDSNGWADIFLHDRRTGSTTRISVSPGEAEGASFSDISAISGDGRRILFASYAKLLPEGQYQSCYLYDRLDGSLSVVNRSSSGAPGNTCGTPTMDFAGNRIAFSTGEALEPGDDNGRIDVYLRDLAAGTTTRISRGLGGAAADGASYRPRLSPDGSQVIYASEASNLVAGDSNGVRDIFRTASDGSGTVRISVGEGGGQANGASHAEAALNWDGSLTAFSSNAGSLPEPGAFSESTLYLRIPSSNETYAVSLPSAGSLAREGFNEQPDFSATGQYLVFASTDDLLLDDDTSSGIYVIDLVDGRLARISQRLTAFGSGNHVQPRISADGTGVVWASNATNLVAGDSNGHWDLFHARNPLHPQVFVDSFED
jgi:Tol biopolymer transport system component